jgi:hypothetical protein
MHERKVQSQSAFMHYATLFGYWKRFVSPEIHKGYILVNWNFCAGDAFTARQTEGN